MLMLQDDSGEVLPIKLDPIMVNSDNAIIVLDEYHDTCWVWIGKNVNMPTRMHALRMGKSIQKSGYVIGVTTIGMASDRLVEIMEKNAGDPDVQAQIDAFTKALDGKWNFEDEVLAYDDSLEVDTGYKPPPTTEVVPTYSSSEPEVETPSPAPVTSPAPEPKAEPPKTITSTKPVTPPAAGLAEKKAAYLLYSTVSNSELVYTERFERNGKLGVKIEVPGIMVLEAVLDGDDLKIEPASFGSNDEATKIKTDYESRISDL